MNPNSISITGKISESQRLCSRHLPTSALFINGNPEKKAVQMPWQFLGLRNEFLRKPNPFTWSRWKGSISNLEKYRKKNCTHRPLWVQLHDVCSHPSHIPMECRGLTVENPPRFSPWSGWKPHGRRTSDFSLFSFSTAASLKWMKFQGGKKPFLVVISLDAVLLGKRSHRCEKKHGQSGLEHDLHSWWVNSTSSC